MNRALLLVDIDGVLNPWGDPDCPTGFREHVIDTDGEPVRLAPVHGEWLRELGASFDLVWASAWGFKAHRLLGPILDLEEFPYIPMPPSPFPAEAKVFAVAAYVKDRPAAWIDDLLTPQAFTWAASREAPTLLISADHTTGMTRQHVEQLLGWARNLS